MGLFEPRLSSSPISAFKLERFFARWEFAVRHVLCASDIEGYRMDDLLGLADDECRELWKSLTLGYTETSGHRLLRVEIARLYQTVGPDQVLCFAGAEEAIYATMRVLLRPGDHVIATWPGYQSLHEVASSLQAEVSPWMLRPERRGGSLPGWAIDLDELKQLMRPSTRLVVTNFPHNPTGALPTRHQWDTILSIVRSAGCFLFSDEVYRLLEYDQGHLLPAAVDSYDRAISLGVMSKPFGLAGLRVGWVACRDGQLLGQLAAFKDYTTICNSAPGEILALVALRARERVLARGLGLIRTNLALVADFMAAHSGHFEWIPPRAGTTAFPRFLGSEAVESWVERLLEAEGVLLLPGTLFDYPGNHFRVGLGRADMPAALSRWDQFLKRNQ